MNTKNRIINLTETLVDCVKYRGIIKALQFLYFHFLSKYFINADSNTYDVFGYKIKLIDKNYLVDFIFEHFGRNIYFFKSKKNAPVIIDIGANIGDTILYFKSIYPDAIIYSFEPHPHAFECLMQNINLNNLSNVKAYNIALGRRKGTAKLFSESGTSANTASLMGSYPRTKNGKKYLISEVEVDKLSNISEIKKLDQVDLLKIDIEGAESEVLQTLDFILKKTEKIIIEFHILPHISENSFDFIVSKLQKHKFKLSVKGFYCTDNNATLSYTFLIIGDK